MKHNERARVAPLYLLPKKPVKVKHSARHLGEHLVVFARITDELRQIERHFCVLALKNNRVPLSYERCMIRHLLAVGAFNTSAFVLHSFPGAFDFGLRSAWVTATGKGHGSRKCATKMCLAPAPAARRERSSESCHPWSVAKHCLANDDDVTREAPACGRLRRRSSYHRRSAKRTFE